MPTVGFQRSWSTQYGEDYNRKQIWNHHRSTRKKTHHHRAFRPVVPRATEIVLPQYTHAFTENCYGLDDPMLDDTLVNGDRGFHVQGVQNDTHSNCARGIQLPDVHDIQLDTVEQENPDPDNAIIHLPAEADPVIPESVPIRSESPELHWICWPEPKKNKSAKRPYTSQGLYTDRKFSGNQTPRNDRDTVVGISFTNPDDLSFQPLNAGQPVQFDPKIKSWTNVSVDNDRKAVDAMFTSMRRSQTFYEPSHKPMTSISVNEPPPKDTYTRYGGQVVDPRSLYQQNFYPYYQPHATGPRDAMHLQELSREMNANQSPAFNYNYSFNKYPLHMRKNKRSAAATDDYVHERSMFMTTTPQCVGHFIIHPDWVSERSSLRRSKSMIQIRGSSKF